MTVYTAYATIAGDPANALPFYDDGTNLQAGYYFSVLGDDGSRLVITAGIVFVTYGDSAADIQAKMNADLISQVSGGSSVTLLDKDIIWL